MPSRRTHKKSRLGCRECKKRKVKCTEVRPSCSYCIRASCPCVYPISTQTLAPRTPPESTIGSSTSPEAFTATGQSTENFDLLDMTLMNHFTAVTALTMFSGEKQRLVWQTDIHFKARSNPMLIHGILSIAGLHLAVLEPENFSHYRLRALHHHDLGVRLFNQELSNITQENSHILFSFAVMLVAWAYASPMIATDNLELDEILGVLELVRGCKTISMLHLNSIKNTPIGSIIDFIPHPRLHQVVLSYVALRVFETLRITVPDSIYDHAISRLESVFMKAAGEPDEVRTLVAWPCLIDEEVWSRFRAKEPKALFVLAHYAMLLERYERQWWWISGWSERILTAVGQVLSNTDKEALGWYTFISRVDEHREEFLSIPSVVE
ncbi:hypothetical protein BKA65DRAFT_469511 [Rhexocercosporidium sp. MPI-PUGE-AT-0058]|nr:hypothetical protein BKA65DRAFT_469511 [Rhexocercosporidium sp. MPI-PUGE-AT-0058]